MADDFNLGALAPRGQVFDLPKPKGGMFGGAKVQIDPGAFLAALAAGLGSPAGAEALRSIHQRRFEAQRQAYEDQQYQNRRQQAFQDQIALYDYKAAHPDDEFTQMLRAAGVDPASEQGKALYLQAVQNKANPFVQMRVQNPDGSESLQFMRPPAVPTAPVGKLTPIGGPGLGGPGGFPGY